MFSDKKCSLWIKTDATEADECVRKTNWFISMEEMRVYLLIMRCQLQR